MESAAFSWWASSTAAPRASSAALGSPLPDSSRCASSKIFLIMILSLGFLGLYPLHNLLRDFFGGQVLDDARLPLLFGWTGAYIVYGLLSGRDGLSALQRGHDSAHVGHTDL